MTDDDIPAVLEIERESLLSLWSSDGYQSELLRTDSKAVVAEKEYKIVGFAILRLIMSASESEILNIAVKREFQNQGIGNALLTEAAGLAKSEGIRSIWLEVRKSNLHAQNFYRRNGFVLSGERKNFYTNPSEDALIMKLDL